jgi:hypothetical protein
MREQGVDAVAHERRAYVVVKLVWDRRQLGLACCLARGGDKALVLTRQQRIECGGPIPALR